MAADRGETAVELLKAAAAGQGFPPAVAGTPANRRLFDEIKTAVADLPEGVVPDIPWDYASDTT